MSLFEKDADGTAPQWVYNVVILGALMAVIAIISLIVRPDESRFTSTAEGVVSRVEVQTRKRKSTSYITYVRFTDSDHQTFEAKSIVNGSWQRHEEGDKVLVYYDPRDPEAGCLIAGDEDKLGEFNIFIRVCQVGGIVCLGAAALWLVVVKIKS